MVVPGGLLPLLLRGLQHVAGVADRPLPGQRHQHLPVLAEGESWKEGGLGATHKKRDDAERSSNFLLDVPMLLL